MRPFFFSHKVSLPYKQEQFYGRSKFQKGEGLAGYAISPISQTDAVVRYFIEHKDYNVIKIDMVLFDYGLDPLSK